MHRPAPAAPPVVVALLAALSLAGVVGGCGSASSTPSNTTPRATVQAFNVDLTRHDFTAACKLVRPFARPLLTDVRTGHSLASCVSGLNAAGAPQRIAHFRLSAEIIRTGTVATLGGSLVSFTPARVPDPVYLLDRVRGVWLIAGL